MTDTKFPGSFRDPSGFIFLQNGFLYRQVNSSYRDNYDHLMNSGLYHSMVDQELLIPHGEVEIAYAKSDDAYKVIKPEPVPFVSYPYEWCFSELKDAALTTLKIQRIALEFGMSLKDCSAYNIQFRGVKPALIDTLSFERYNEGKPWVGYKQFCQHFLAPLSLASFRDMRLNQLSRLYIDGIPLDFTSALLPFRTYFRPFLLLHLHFHAKSQRRYAGRITNEHLLRGRKFSLRSFLGLIDSLESSIRKLSWHPRHDNWATYYEETDSYTSDAIEHKRQIVAGFLDQINPKLVWDLGSNTGLFSNIASDKGIQTISFDMDPGCVEMNYLSIVANGRKTILPLVLDLTNPSPSIGWQNQERLSILERGPADAVLALALIHHLAISNNLPLDQIASFFKKICTSLIIEFVPKSDRKVQQLLSTREDIFSYTKESFEHALGKVFLIRDCVRIRDSDRILYWMEKR